MIIYLKGDATDPKTKGPKIIAHICNNKGGWGKGFVLALSKKWKEPESEYRDWYKRGIDFTLGRVQYVKVESDILIANMIAQEGFKTSSVIPPIRYEALYECLTDLYLIAKTHKAGVHMPRIGTGLAGGKWEEIGPMIEKIFIPTPDFSAKVFVYEYSK